MLLQSRKKSVLLVGFMLTWFIINCLQATLVGVDGDEAYYWVLSQHLSFGYFDHPPMVTLLMRIGESIAHGPFFTRLGTVLLSTFTILIIYKSLPEDLKNIRYFILVFAGTVILNVYSFIATPDAPLFFFAALFFLGYKYYLQKENYSSVLLLVLSITGMLYSKYHGILPVLFTVASNWQLLRKKSFWLIVLLVSIAFTPHLIWQWKHDWPTFRFHLFERNASDYEIEFTSNYILGQVLVWGPFTFILFLRHIFRVKTSDKFIKAHLFTFYGILVFFFISSFTNSVEPHWTLVAGVSFVTLFVHILLHAKEKYRTVATKIFIANIVLIALARILFALPHSPFLTIKNYKPFFLGKEWASTLRKKAGDTPVVFVNSYIFPSLYSYYNPRIEVGGYNEKSYRKTQYSLTASDCRLDGKPVWIFDGNIPRDSVGFVSSPYQKGVLRYLNSYTCTNALKINAVNIPDEMKAGETIAIDILLLNEGQSTIANRNSLHIDYAFFTGKYEFTNSNASYPIEDTVLPGGYQKKMRIQLTAPSAKGNYNLLFSIVSPPFKGNFASQFLPVKVR